MIKTTITVVGTGNRMKGTSSKNNKPYDFQDIAFTYTDPWITGVKAATVGMKGPDIDAKGGIFVGDVYEAVISERNGYISGICLL